MVDGVRVATVAAEAVYMIGMAANTALPGSWSMLGDAIPMPARRVTLTPTTDACYVRVVSYELYALCLQLGLNPANAVQIPLVPNIAYSFENVLFVYYQRIIGDGVLNIVAQA